LIGLIDTALNSNWDVLAAYQRIQMAQSDVLFNSGALKPFVDAGLTISQRKFGLYTMDGAGNISTYMEPEKIVPIHLPDYYPGIHASWEADIFGKLRNRKRAAANLYLASVEGRNFVVTNLIADIANNYYGLMALDNKLSILNETIVLQEEAYEMVKVQKDAGTVNALAVKQFEAQLLNSKSLSVEVRQQIIELESQINFLLGRYPQHIIRDSLQTINLPSQINSGLPTQLLSNRSDIRQAEFELEAANADVKAARAAFYPSLNFNGSIGFQAYKTSLLFQTPESYAYSLIGSLAAPIFNRSAIKAEFRMANARKLDALYNFQKSVVNAYMEVYNTVAGLSSLDEIYSLKTAESKALTESVETSSELFKTGRADYIEVLLAQQKALQSRLELVNVRNRQLSATVDLYRALGGGWR
jgi:NodT family efflux transporter outer membrane factor (OMF) lipoprotein